MKASFREPEWLLCPITHAMFRDPVVVADSGNTYERSAILAYWREHRNPRDPLTNVNLKNNILVINRDKRREVQDFLDRHPDYTPVGWDCREVPCPDEVKAGCAHRSNSAQDNIRRHAQADEAGRRGIKGWSGLILLCFGVSVVVHQLSLFYAPFGRPGCCTALVAYSTLGVAQGVGDIKRVMEALQDYPLDRKVQCCGFRVLSELARGNVQRGIAIAEAGGVERVVAALRAHPTDASVQGYACEALMHLALNNSIVEESIAREHGVERIIAAMWNHPLDSFVQERASDALTTLVSASQKNAVAVLEAGGVKLLVAALQNYQGRHGFKMLERACVTLQVLVDKNIESRIAVAQAGGIEHIVAALMKRRQYGQVMHECACAVLSKLAHNNAKNSAAIAEAGGVSEIITLLSLLQRRKTADDSAQTIAWEALANLALNSADSIAQAGGIRLVVSALQDRPTDAKVQARACQVLSGLAARRTGRNAILRAGGIHHIISALWNHPTEPEVQAHACRSLGMLAMDDTANRIAIIRAGGIERIISALREHPTDEYVFVYACEAISNLAVGISEDYAFVEARLAETALQGPCKRTAVTGASCHTPGTLVLNQSLSCRGA